MQKIELDGVCVRAEKRNRLFHVCTKVSDGDFILVLGANGAGKSTLLDVIASLIRPDAGSVTLDNLPLGYIPQSPERSLSGQTVVDEIAFHLGVRSASLLKDWENVKNRLESFGLANVHPHANPLTWSIGMQRRFAMILTLLNPPQTLLLDEPSAGLDSASVTWLQQQIESLRDAGCTILLSTHHLDTFAEYANRVWILSKGQILFDGTPSDIYHHPDILKQAGAGLPPSLRLQCSLADAKLMAHPSLISAHALAQKLTLPDEIGDDIDIAMKWRSEAPAVSANANVNDKETQNRRSIDARASLFSTSLLALTLASFHPLAASVIGVIATFVLIFWVQSRVQSIVRWTIPWMVFAIVAMVVSGTHLHALWSQPAQLFDWGLAWQALISVLPYWCYLQLGQVVVTHMSAMEFEGMVDWILTKGRLKQTVRHITTLTGGMVFRFLPAISQMFQEQMRAVRIRSLSPPHTRRIFRNWNRHSAQRGTNPFHISHVLTPLIIRLIAYGETTASALEARQIFTNPVPYTVFIHRKMNRRSIALLGIGLVSSALVIVAGVLQIHGK